MKTIYLSKINVSLSSETQIRCLFTHSLEIRWTQHIRFRFLAANLRFDDPAERRTRWPGDRFAAMRWDEFAFEIDIKYLHCATWAVFCQTGNKQQEHTVLTSTTHNFLGTCWPSSTSTSAALFTVVTGFQLTRPFIPWSTTSASGGFLHLFLIFLPAQIRSRGIVGTIRYCRNADRTAPYKTSLGQNFTRKKHHQDKTATETKCHQGPTSQDKK